MKVAVISHRPAQPFVQRDVEVLRSLGYGVTLHQLGGPKDLLRLALSSRSPRMNHPLIFWAAGWSAGIWSRFSPIIRNPIIAVIGGGEVLTSPGRLREDRTREMWIRRTLGSCDAAVFVAPHLLSSAASAGFLLPRRLVISPTSVDYHRFVPLPKKPKTAALIAGVSQPSRVHVKGIDRLKHLAEANPEWTFTAVGLSEEVQASMQFPENVIVHSFVSEEPIIEILGRSEVILCLSRWEGMPNSLIEGMMCGCIPVVSDDVSSLPWAAGRTGHVLHDPNGVDLNGMRGDGTAARERAISLFSPARRAKMWSWLLPEVLRARSSD